MTIKQVVFWLIAAVVVIGLIVYVSYQNAQAISEASPQNTPAAPGTISFPTIYSGDGGGLLVGNTAAVANEFAANIDDAQLTFIQTFNQRAPMLVMQESYALANGSMI